MQLRQCAFEEVGWFDADSVEQVQEFDEIEPALQTFDFADIARRQFQPRRHVALCQARSPTLLCQQLNQPRIAGIVK